MEPERRVTLLRATAIGVGAIVGGGILALAGAAFSVTGPSAMLAFTLNGLIALLTALSFAEISTKFPQSGGTYVFAKKVLSVEVAFVVGWVVWFASIVAAVLYAIGFGQFAAVAMGDLMPHDWGARDWLPQNVVVNALAMISVVFYSLLLFVNPAGGGLLANIAKLVAFGILIATGLWAMWGRTGAELVGSLQPFFAAGAGGLFKAMGFTFIALQGFDLIAAVAGDIREPRRTIPLAMFGSLGIALLIYLPLLLVIATVGIPAGESVLESSRQHTETIVAIAAENYLGRFGYWLVIAAAILSMLSALEANLYAASRVALAMSRDHTLPVIVGRLSTARHIPRMAVFVSSILIIAVIWLIPDLAAAGAAASLVFLVTFTLAHVIAVLVRRRSRHEPPPFRTPWFPLVPLVGGLSCFALAVYQGWAVPSAGLIATAWIGVGIILFLVLFARRARLADVSAAALDPEIVRLRGRRPLVLVPVANPANASGLMELANALAVPGVGRVLLLSVVAADGQADGQASPDARSPSLENALHVIRSAVTTSTNHDWYPEVLVTVAGRPWPEIARVAKFHRCESLLVGLSQLDNSERRVPLDELLNAVDCDIVVLRAPTGWQIDGARRIVIPTTGRGVHDRLLVRLLASLHRSHAPSIRFVRVLPEGISLERARTLERATRRYTNTVFARPHDVRVLCSDTPVDIVIQEVGEADLVIMGVERASAQQKLIGHFVQSIARQSQVPLLIVSCSC